MLTIWIGTLENDSELKKKSACTEKSPSFIKETIEYVSNLRPLSCISTTIDFCFFMLLYFKNDKEHSDKR
jgi:hypothetical protein